jgi:hypothetical protein
MKAKGTTILAIAAASLIGLTLTPTPSDAAWRGGWRGGGWHAGWVPGWRGARGYRYGGWRPGLAIGAAAVGVGLAASSWAYPGGGYYGYPGWGYYGYTGY